MDSSSNIPQEQLLCGLVMPISAMGDYSPEHWSEMRDILSECIGSISEFKFHVKMVSDADDVAVIHKTIVQNLYKSDIVICDVSGKNPNVMFELGMRLAFDKPTVIIKDDATEYPFDTGIIEHITYPRDHRFAKMRIFTNRLKEKVLATYKAWISNPSHSIFLKNFGDFTSPVLGKTSRDDEMSTIVSLLNVVIQNQAKSIEQKGGDPMQSHRSSSTFSSASIARGDFINFYQPIVNLAGDIVGLETLVRKKTNDVSAQLPHTFLPYMEEAGLIAELQIHVIRTVVSDFANWAGKGLPIPRISINLPPLKSFHENIYRELALLIESTHGKIDVEVTESALMDSSEAGIAHLNRLKNLGVNIVIDDFGTGYSSLSLLKQFPIDYIKIDRSFISGITRGVDDVAITQAIVSLSRSLGVKVIAEGVETDSQAALLRSFECDEMQGFLFGEPIAAHKVQELLKNGRLS